MKHLRGLFALTLAASMTLSATPVAPIATAFASDTHAAGDSTVAQSTGTITVPNETGHTYNIYQVFTGTPRYDETDSDKIVGLNDLKYGSNTSNGHTIGAAVTQSDLQYLATIDFTEANNTTGTADKAEIDKLLSYVDLTGTPAQGTTPLEPGATSASLPTGYYLVKDVDNTQGSNTNYKKNAYTLYLLQVVDGNITLEAKQDTPEVEKKVADINDSTSATADAFDKSADYDIGDAVPFQLTATTASNAHNYVKYHVEFQDKQCAGLDAPEEYTVTVLSKTFYMDKDGKFYTSATFATEVSADTAGTEVTDNGTKITVRKGTLDTDQTFSIRVDFESNDITTAPYVPAEVDSTSIVVTYDAVLNTSAVIGNDGNKNDVYLDFSNNPNSADGEEEGETTEDTVVVFTYKVDVDKIDQDYAALSGAGFTLLKKYSALPTGTTAAQISTLNNTATENSWFTDGTSYWKVVGKGGASDVVADGQFHWKGIDDGIYKLVETTVPTGYNKAADVDFTVTATHGADTNSSTGYKVSALSTNSSVFQASPDGGEFTFTKNGDRSKTHVMGSPADTEAKVVTSVVNQSGTELPSTGGIGTTIFYVVGGILVAGAAVTLVVRRRAQSEA